jgi:hypothetical protein
LTVAFVIILVFFVVQVIVAITTGPRLLSDAGHMLTGALAWARRRRRRHAAARNAAGPTASTASKCSPP